MLRKAPGEVNRCTDPVARKSLSSAARSRSMSRTQCVHLPSQTLPPPLAVLPSASSSGIAGSRETSPQYLLIVRVAFMGGTFHLGPVAVRQLVESGHTVVVAHSCRHGEGATAERAAQLAEFSRRSGETAANDPGRAAPCL